MKKVKNLIFDGNGVIYKSAKDSEGKKIRVIKDNKVKKTLEKLKKKYNLFILTDGTARIEKKREALKRMKVFKYFKDVLGTYEMKMSKKNKPATFLTALRLWNLKIKNSLFIGHDNRELRNAELAGLKTIKTSDISEITEL